MTRGYKQGKSAARGAKKLRGNALTEFALVIPFLLAVMFGVIEFGRALYTYHFVSDAAREASRWACVRGQNCKAFQQACPASPSQVVDYVVSIAPPGIDTSPQKLAVSPAWVAAPGAGNACLILPKSPGCQAVQVTVTYRFKFILPFMPTSTYPMQSTSEMVILE
jgi:Flp pilus assembly protein TadG